MEANVYAPPSAVVMDAPKARASEFYVVSKAKFFALFYATLGAYQLYWFYRHWSRYRAHHREKLQPVWRAVFAIFFTHALGDRISQSLGHKGIRHRWSPGALAAGYVLFQVIATVCDRLSANNIGSPTTDVIGLLSLLPIGHFLWCMQDAANLACHQPRGESNRTFTWANWLWFVLGAFLWLMVLLGLAMTFGWVQLEG